MQLHSKSWSASDNCRCDLRIAHVSSADFRMKLPSLFQVLYIITLLYTSTYGYLADTLPLANLKELCMRVSPSHGSGYTAGTNAQALIHNFRLRLR